MAGRYIPVSTTHKDTVRATRIVCDGVAASRSAVGIAGVWIDASYSAVVHQPSDQCLPVAMSVQVIYDSLE